MRLPSAPIAGRPLRSLKYGKSGPRGRTVHAEVISLGTIALFSGITTGGGGLSSEVDETPSLRGRKAVCGSGSHELDLTELPEAELLSPTKEGTTICFGSLASKLTFPRALMPFPLPLPRALIFKAERGVAGSYSFKISWMTCNCRRPSFSVAGILLKRF